MQENKANNSIVSSKTLQPKPWLSRPWRWTPARTKAAALIAEDKLTQAEIADKIGVSRVALWQWNKRPEFASRIEELVQEEVQEVKRKWFMHGPLRARLLARDIRATDIILEERGKQLQDELNAAEVTVAADNAEHADKKPPASETNGDPYAGGARTGFIARDYKMAGNGTTRPVYAFDAALMRERRANLEAISKHLGQWDAENETGIGVNVTVNLTPQDEKL
jgi:transcriptional regulator with XRE-family HTH domain